MSLFRKARGMPIIWTNVVNGQHVEGWYKSSYDTFWSFTKDATVETVISDSNPHYYVIEIYLLIRGNVGKVYVGKTTNGMFSSSYSIQIFKMYDGCRYYKRRKRIFP